MNKGYTILYGVWRKKFIMSIFITKQNEAEKGIFLKVFMAMNCDFSIRASRQ